MLDNIRLSNNHYLHILSTFKKLRKKIINPVGKTRQSLSDTGPYIVISFKRPIYGKEKSCHLHSFIFTGITLAGFFSTTIYPCRSLLIARSSCNAAVTQYPVKPLCIFPALTTDNDSTSLLTNNVNCCQLTALLNEQRSISTLVQNRLKYPAMKWHRKLVR